MWQLKGSAKRPRFARALVMSMGVQLEYVEVPRGMINEETIINKVAAFAVIDLDPHPISQTHLLAANFRKGKFQPALPLVVRIIDDNDMATVGLAGPGMGDEAVRGRIGLAPAPAPLRTGRHKKKRRPGDRNVMIAAARCCGH